MKNAIDLYKKGEISAETAKVYVILADQQADIALSMNKHFELLADQYWSKYKELDELKEQLDELIMEAGQ